MNIRLYIIRYHNYKKKHITKLIKKNLVFVNGVVIDIDYMLLDNDIIKIDNKIITYNDYVYYIINKPKLHICSHFDDTYDTVLSLIKEDDLKPGLFMSGRLDLNTTGCLLITNDGKFSKYILSPENHIDKTYRVSLKYCITSDAIEKLEKGILIENTYKTKPSKVEVIDLKTIYLTISEGKFHQVKKMLFHVDNYVVDLHRVSLGKYTMPNNLKIGEYIKIDKNELLEKSTN